MQNITLTSHARKAWREFLANKNNLGHVKRENSDNDIDLIVNAGMISTRATISRVKHDLGEVLPMRILEIGCSAGLNCIALQEAYPDAEVIGIEPEAEALFAAESLRGSWAGRWPSFEKGFGESIPFPGRSFDLVICHTVIEHVRDVPQVIAEIARVLSPNGIAHLEAPNYIWPYEPHLEIWTIPLLGKPFVEICGRLQGKKEMLAFIKHLQFVTPFQLQKLFLKNGLVWHNRSDDKIRQILTGKGDVKKYKLLARFLNCVGRVGLAEVVARSILTSGMYPSVLYTLRLQKDYNGQI